MTTDMQQKIEAAIREYCGDTAPDDDGAHVAMVDSPSARNVPIVPGFNAPNREAWSVLADYAREILDSGGLDVPGEARWLQLLWFAEREYARDDT